MHYRLSAAALAIGMTASSIGLVVAAPAASLPSWPLVSDGYTLEPIAYEGFSYGAGTIANRTGGTGWADAWMPDPHSTAQDFLTNQAGLTYPGLPTDDSAIRATATGGTNSDTARTLDDSLDSGVVYFQFLSIFQTNHGGGTPNIRFKYEGARTGAIGNNGFSPSNMALMDSNLSPVAVSTAPLTQLNLTILRIDYERSITSMWVNPDLSTFDYANPPTDDTFAIGFAPRIDRIYPISRYGGDPNKDKFDEIRFMRLIAPAPDPSPPAPDPAGAPLDPTAIEGDRSARVTWSPPTSSGSFAISHYQAVSSPGGRMCLTRDLTCEVGGLSNGTAYTFTVRALTGAGWSPNSAPSNMVVPRAPERPTITITGSRDGERISIAGSSTGMGMGAIAIPWTSRDGAAYVQRRDVLMAEDGTFTWSRRAKADSTWRVYVTSGDLRSNTVRIR